MNKSVLITLFCALVFAGLSGGLWFSRPPDQTLRVAALELELTKTKQDLDKLKSELALAHKAVSASRAAAATSVAAKESKPPAAAADDGGARVSAENKGTDSFAKLMSDPKMRDMVKAQQTAQLDMQYGKLFGLLSLSEEEVSHFKKLLGERLSHQTDLGLQFMDTSLTPEKRKEMSATFDAKQKASMAAIKEFLNDDKDFGTFENWEKTQPERMQMMMGRGAFDGAGTPLSGDQEEQLINLMADVRQRPSNLPDWTDPKKMDPSAFNESNLPKILLKYDDDAKAVLRDAATFLSPEQLAALAKMQKQMRDMTEMGIKMSATMLGGGKK